MKKILLITLALLAAASLQADTITQTNSFSGTPTFSANLTFDQFDDNGGLHTLNSVTVRMYLTTLAGARFDVDNEGDATTGTASFGTTGALSSSDVFLGGAADVSTLSTKFMTLGADDDDGAGYQPGGVDYDFLITTEQSDSNLINVGSGFFFQYTGTGTYDIGADFTALTSFSSGGTAGAFSALDANGRVEVVYDYTAVPEPATASLMALVAGLGFLIRRHFIS